QLRLRRVDVSRADAPQDPVLVLVDGDVPGERRHGEGRERAEGLLYVERGVQHLARTSEEVDALLRDPRLRDVVDDAHGEDDLSVDAADGIRAHDGPALFARCPDAIPDQALGRLAAERAPAGQLLDRE